MWITLLPNILGKESTHSEGNSFKKFQQNFLSTGIKAIKSREAIKNEVRAVVAEYEKQKAGGFRFSEATYAKQTCKPSFVLRLLGNV